MAKQLHLVSSAHLTCLQKLKTLLLCAFRNCNLSVLCCFWSTGFFLAILVQDLFH